MHENQGYNLRQTQQQQEWWMPKKPNTALTDFGQRLAQFRKAAGYTQQQLATEIGVTRRVIAYYETESQHPPANLLVDLAQALGVSTDEMLGLKPTKKSRKPDTRLQRRIQQIEKMGAKEKRQLIQLIDTFIENMQLKKKVKV
jgi:transcriptional regulator with XRE-family HTH domain